MMTIQHGDKTLYVDVRHYRIHAKMVHYDEMYETVYNCFNEAAHVGQVKQHHVCFYKPSIQAATVIRMYPNSDREDIAAMGFAFCSTEDMFSRKKGRTIALNRALKEYDAKRTG